MQQEKEFKSLAIDTAAGALKNVTEEDKKEGKNAQEALLESMMKLADSDDPKDQELHAEITKRFTEKMESFSESIQALPRKMRRKMKGYNSYSNRFKKRIGL